MSAKRPYRGSKPPHRIYEPGKRHMELIASVSRSSGLEKDGDALRDYKIQEEYYTFIQEKVQDYWKKYPQRFTPVQGKEEKQKLAESENILILYRKLREGISSTKRCDEFALKVYETSLYLSILFRSPVQTASTLSYLLPNLYLSLASTTSTDQSSTPHIPHDISFTALLSLLHDLLTAYPSQKLFYERLASLPPSSFPRHSKAYQWVHQLAKCLRARNYARLASIAQPAVLERFAAHSGGHDLLTPIPTADTGAGRRATSKGTVAQGPQSAPPHLPLEALRTLVEALCDKAREATWQVLRTSYRELVCSPPATGSHTDTSEWLARSLVLRSQLGNGAADREIDISAAVDRWLQQRCSEGEAKRKEGDNMQGRWILAKPPALK